MVEFYDPHGNAQPFRLGVGSTFEKGRRIMSGLKSLRYDSSTDLKEVVGCQLADIGRSYNYGLKEMADVGTKILRNKSISQDGLYFMFLAIDLLQEQMREREREKKGRIDRNGNPIKEFQHSPEFKINAEVERLKTALVNAEKAEKEAWEKADEWRMAAQASPFMVNVKDRRYGWKRGFAAGWVSVTIGSLLWWLTQNGGCL